jgi:hypothetical protein
LAECRKKSGESIVEAAAAVEANSGFAAKLKIRATKEY